MSQADYTLLSYDPWNKARIVICSADDSTYLHPMKEICGRDFFNLFLDDVNLCENPLFVFLDDRLL